jgi:hypothetical protein
VVQATGFKVEASQSQNGLGGNSTFLFQRPSEVFLAGKFIQNSRLSLSFPKSIFLVQIYHT